jgi:hypothetical protein
MQNKSMEYDKDKVDEMVLALLFLTLHDGCRAWKGLDWEAMNRLHEKGMIGDPVGKAKSVMLTEEGLRRCEEHRATLLAARFRLGPCRRSACFLYGADDVHGLVRWDQAVNSGDALACAFLPARFWFSDVSPFA